MPSLKVGKTVRCASLRSREASGRRCGTSSSRLVAWRANSFRPGRSPRRAVDVGPPCPLHSRTFLRPCPRRAPSAKCGSNSVRTPHAGDVYFEGGCLATSPPSSPTAPGGHEPAPWASLSWDGRTRRLQDPSRCMGAHFFSPANVMQLLENVRTAKASDRTIATGMAFGKLLGKKAVLVGNCDGFVGNRMLAPYASQAGVARAVALPDLTCCGVMEPCHGDPPTDRDCATDGRRSMTGGDDEQEGDDERRRTTDRRRR